MTEIVTEFDADYDYVTNQGPKAVFHTNKNAENYRLITIDLEKPAEANWLDLVKVRIYNTQFDLPNAEKNISHASHIAGRR